MKNVILFALLCSAQPLLCSADVAYSFTARRTGRSVAEPLSPVLIVSRVKSRELTPLPPGEELRTCSTAELSWIASRIMLNGAAAAL